MVVMFFERGVLHKIELILKFEFKKRIEKGRTGGEEETNKSS